MSGATAPVEIQIKATGVDGVQRSLRLVKDEIKNVEQATTGMSHSGLIGFGELSRGIAKVAQAGQVGAFAMKEFTGAAFRLGEYLMPGGELIGILGLAGYAIYEFWHSGADAAKKAREEWEKALDALAHGTLAAAAVAQQHLYSGDPLAALTGQREGESSIAFLGRSGGQLALEREQSRLTPLLAAINKQTNFGTTATTQQKLDRDSYIGQLKEINSLLAQYDIRLVSATAVTDMLMKKEQEMAAFQLQYGPAGKSAAQQALFEGGIGGRGRFGDISPAMYGLAPGLTGEKDYGGKYMNVGKIVAKQIPENAFHDAQVESLKQLEKFKDALSHNFAKSLGEGVAAGITAAFDSGNVGAAFAAMGETLLAGLGGVFQDLGATYIEYSGIMEAFAKFLPDPFTAGWAGLAIGTALEALGASLNAVGRRHASGAYAGGYSAAGAYGAQSALAGQGSITVVLPRGGSFLDPNNPDTMQAFVDALRKAFGNRLVSTTELG